MPPLNLINDTLKPQTVEMESDLRENFSEQQLVRDSNGSSADTVVIRNARDRPVTKRQIISIFILCFVNLINYMDRYTIAGVLIDIGKTFDLTESKLGLLQTAFIVVYMLMAPLFGYLGDRFNRKYLMAVGVFIWSLTTLLGSFMPNYELFVLMRCFVGIGEASYSTIAPTIISDIFVGNARSKMLAVFYFAIPVGSGLGYIIGAEVSNLAKSMLPVERELDAWRWGLRVTPVLGLIAVLLILFVLQEPVRGEREGAQDVKASDYMVDVKYLFSNRSYIFSTLGFTCIAYVAGALAWWGPKYVELGALIQTDANVNSASVSFIFGITAMIAGIIGVALGSGLGQKLRVRFPSADPIVCGAGALISMPLIMGGMFLAGINSAWAFVVVTFGQIALNLNWSIVPDILMYICIPTRRATGAAFQILISHTFGDAGSPYICGLVAEAFKPLINSSLYIDDQQMGFEPTFALDLSNATTTLPTVTTTFVPPSDTFIEYKALQYSLCICLLVQIPAGLFFFCNAFYIRKDKLRCDMEIAGLDDNSQRSLQPTHRYADETETEQTNHLIIS